MYVRASTVGHGEWVHPLVQLNYVSLDLILPLCMLTVLAPGTYICSERVPNSAI